MCCQLCRIGCLLLIHSLLKYQIIVELLLSESQLKMALTPEIVEQETQSVLFIFFDERMQRDGIEKTAEMQQLLDSEVTGSQNMATYKQYASMVLLVADEIDSKYNTKIQDLASTVPPNAEREIIKQVAEEILSGGITWGKIAALFLFTYKVCIRVLDRFPLITNIINIVLDFMAVRVVHWIIQKGGWKSIQENMIRPLPDIFRISLGVVFLSVGVFLLFWYRK
ncbi:bcl-2 homologous antagonist/killer-like isoform X1 [Biomphalaria glabrata]|uniref:Bcl-2 homologous antagonist/killer-like isoform X1 n=2 Tax=Biomphalaria glabrata TaxID=6526 RepID=A0A9W3BE06_BIOGL|nr:bcl-2 homologous antagonist/killer-like isoform X1 [Biomphalaria glabrata]